jgi:hypothetical protein
VIETCGGRSSRRDFFMVDSSPEVGRLGAGSTGRGWGRRVGSIALAVTKGCQIEQFAHAVFPSTYAELLVVTAGEAADVA